MNRSFLDLAIQPKNKLCYTIQPYLLCKTDAMRGTILKYPLQEASLQQNCRKCLVYIHEKNFFKSLKARKSAMIVKICSNPTISPKYESPSLKPQSRKPMFFQRIFKIAHLSCALAGWIDRHNKSPRTCMVVTSCQVMLNMGYILESLIEEIIKKNYL